jgi:hypothetical protein
MSSTYADELVTSATPRSRDAMAPPVPLTLADTGLSEAFVSDLLLKILYARGTRTGQQLADAIRLPFPVIDEPLLTLQQRRMLEVRSTSGHGRTGYLFDITGPGVARAQEAQATSQYAGPAPVPLEQYRAWSGRQSISDAHVTRADIRRGFGSLVLEEEFLDLLGPAVNSAKSIFLYGDSGNGKTLIADTIAAVLGDSIHVPYAIQVDGQIILVHDPVYHRRVEGDPGESGGGTVSLWLTGEDEHDRRWVRARRPVVVTGGELTLDELDLRYDPNTRVYQAPFQVKANGGVLIIDDFGRQRVPPRDLLNRWIVPLEKRIDYLTLHTGSKFPLPFDCLVIFATNLDPRGLVEEAFLRRIHYKLHVRDPERAQYEEIFRRCCADRGIGFDARGVEHIYSEFYGTRGIEARSCHPRDILDHLCDAARYLEVPPTLSDELLDRACNSYFLDVAVPDAD